MDQSQQNSTQQIAPEPISAPPKAKQFWTRGKTVTVVVILIIVALVVGYITGILYFGVKNPEQKITVRTVVCGDGDVERYNSPILAEKPPKDYAEEFDALYNEIRNRPGNEQDATCQYILYAIAYSNNDNTMKQYVDNVEDLNSNGEYSNNKIYQLKDIKTMRSLLP